MQSFFDTQNNNNTSTNFHEVNSDTAGGLGIYYSNNNFPNTSIEVLTINYYDDYTFDKDGLSLPSSWAGQTIVNYNNTSKLLTKGLATGSKVRVLGTSNWITTITGYDVKGRPIYVASKNNYLETTDIIKSELDFVGKVIETTTEHTNSKENINNAITVVDAFSYDHMGRLITQKQKIDNKSWEYIVKNSYDELGQLIVKSVGGGSNSPLQVVNYKYNIRGWLKNINDPQALGFDLFRFEIGYNEGAKPLYNGNISSTAWKTFNDDVYTKKYDYSYDALNRITKAIEATDHYSLDLVSYDKNGNIKRLKRKGHIVENPTYGISRWYGRVFPNHFGTMDDLTYSYDGNKLMRVSDAIVTPNLMTGDFKDDNNSTLPDPSNDYTYDANGNMLTDVNKGISTNIEYNHLNLPTNISFSTGNISYIYDATGIKLSKKVVESGKPDKFTYYAGNYVYDNSSLKFFNQPEGYVEPSGTGGYDYVYQYKDHLGNIRLSYKEDDRYGFMPIYTNVPNWAGWSANNSSAQRLSGSGPLRFSSYKKDAGVINKILSESPYYPGVGQGQPLTIKLGLIDASSTPFIQVAVYLEELDGQGNMVSEVLLDADAASKVNTYTHTVQHPATQFLGLRIVKGDDSPYPADIYVVNLQISTGELKIVEENNYYPFGLKHKGYNNVINGTAHPYKFGGKEYNEELGLDLYDYGARMYDPSIGRWHVTDNLSELYFSNSTYVYALNTPIQATDPDGNIVIFINGMHGGSGGKAEYWRSYQKVNYMSGTKSFAGFSWHTYGTYMKETAAFDTSVMNRFGDSNSMYLDGSMGGALNTVLSTRGLVTSNLSAKNRVDAGYSRGKKEAKSIIANLTRDKTSGEIIETIKIITHSMGGAYGKGFIKALKEYVKTLPKEQQSQIKFSVYDFDPHQAGSLTADGETPTFQFKHQGFWNILGLGWLANQDENGKVDVQTNTGNSTDHSIMTFFNDISNMSEGTYKWDGKNWVKQ
ncbi:hypothetical protein EC396_11295 [Lutibacter sp. HS1-25]|nr:hypothetical protein EC396_11295 [Lutibacter sp. HS1-25]